MGKYFGTDGIRAIAGRFPLTDDFVTKLGFCALHEIVKASGKDHLKNEVIVAMDSRESGPALLESLQKGIRAAGVDVVSIGVAPTPAVACIVKATGAVCGVVISASHNPAEFNGIKFFTNAGTKLPEELENKIEAEIEALQAAPAPAGTFREDVGLVSLYKDFLKSTVDARYFKGVKLILDTAHGASYKIAPEVFTELGAEVVVIGNHPDGKNINQGLGALHTEQMQALVVQEQAFGGFSFDGDADRVIAADEKGRQLDGDNIIASAALCLKNEGALPDNTVVLTIMANLGCINYLKAKGIKTELTQVGDKYVSETLEKYGLAVGGETSGHIIFRKYSNTGDGILSALQFLQFAQKEGKPFSFFEGEWRKYPSKLTAVKVKEKIPLESIDGFIAAVETIEKQMNGKGRVIVRYSGTEPLLRILVEGETAELVDKASHEIETLYLSKTEAL